MDKKEKIKEAMKRAVSRHALAFQKLARFKKDVCDGCGCNPCDCGWGNDE